MIGLMGPGVGMGGGRGKLASNVMRGMGVRGARGKTDLGQTITNTDRRLREKKMFGSHKINRITPIR